MDAFDRTFNRFASTASVGINETTNGIGIPVLNLLLLLYITKFAPELPQNVAVWFNNQYVRLAVFTIVLWSASVSPSLAIMIAAAFIVSVNYLNNKPLWEFMKNVKI